MADAVAVQRLSDLISEYLKKNGYTNLDLTPGSPIYEILVRGLAISVSSIADDILDLQDKLFLEDIDSLSFDDLKRLAAIYQIPVNEPSYATVKVRIYLSQPTDLNIPSTASFYTSNGLNFYPADELAFQAEEFIFDSSNGYYYVEILVTSESTGDAYAINAGEIIGASGFDYDFVTNPYPATGGSSGDTFDSLKEKILDAVSTRELVTKSSISYFIRSKGFNPDFLQIIGQKDPELTRDVKDYIKTGHTVDIYYHELNFYTQSVTVEFDATAFKTDTIWLKGRTYVSVDGSTLDVNGNPVGAFDIEKIEYSIDGGTTFVEVPPDMIGSTFGAGNYGYGPYGVGDAVRWYIRSKGLIRSAENAFDIYLDPVVPINYVRLTLKQYTNINVLQGYINDEGLVTDYLVRGFYRAYPFITLTLKEGKEPIDPSILREELAKKIKAKPVEEGLDLSFIISTIESLYPTSYLVSYSDFYIKYEIGYRQFYYAYESDGLVRVPGYARENITSRLYVFDFYDLEGQIVINTT